MCVYIHKYNFFQNLTCYHPTLPLNVLSPTIAKVWIQTYKKVSDYDQEIPQSHTADQPTAPRGEPHNTSSHKIYQEDNQNKATSSFFPIKMNPKLERTLSTA